MTHTSRRVFVNITYENPDGTLQTENRQDVAVDILINALATKINEYAMTIPYTPADLLNKPVGMIKDYSDAIVVLSQEKIEPIFIRFVYRDGVRKTYEILGEKE